MLFTLLEIQVFGGNGGRSILMKGVSAYKVVYISGNPYDTEYWTIGTNNAYMIWFCSTRD